MSNTAMQNFVIFKISYAWGTWFPDGPEYPESRIVMDFEPIGSAHAPSKSAAVKCFGARSEFKAVPESEVRHKG